MNIRCAIRAVIIVLFAAGGVALAGCGDKCAGVYCAPCNAFTGDIVVAFDRDSLQGGFRKTEIDGAYAVLYVAPGFASPVDTVRQIRGGADFYRGYVSLGTLPWSIGPTTARGPYPGSYNFRFVLPRATRTYEISNIEIQTGASSGGDGCCDCGENKRRRFVLNGTSVVADGNENNERATLLRR